MYRKNRISTYHGFLIALLLIVAMLAACTRDRETADPGAVTTAGDVTPALAPETVGEPEVSTAAPDADAGADQEGESAEDASSDAAVESAPTTPPEPTETPAPSTGQESFQYTVEEGDTIASIAEFYGTDISTLRQMNFLVDDNILVGQVLRVPLEDGYTSEGPPTPTPEPLYYVVQPGDSLNGISVQFGVSPTDIIAVNGIVDQNNIPVGQSLLIPGVAQTSAGGSEELSSDDTSTGSDSSGNASGGSRGQAVHIVKPGEALGAIAELYGVDVGELSAANNITNRDLLRVGQRLYIPGLTPREAAVATQLVHVVKSGEGLLGIAEFYGVDGAEIVRLNQLQNSDLIYPGQELLIPEQ